MVDAVRRILDANKYMTLATADADGVPWASPVYFTPVGYREIYWVSGPETRHSRNIAVRPEVGLVAFDSTVPIGGAEALYLRARAELVPDDEVAERAAVYAARYPELTEFTPEELRPPAAFRLYRAIVGEHSLLLKGSDPLNPTGADSRIMVYP